METISIADIRLTNVQLFYKESRIAVYFKSNVEVNSAFKEHIQALYVKFIRQESVPVTIDGYSFESRIISLAGAASPEQYASENSVERLMCGDEFTIAIENNGHIPENTAEQRASKAGSAPLILKK